MIPGVSKGVAFAVFCHTFFTAVAETERMHMVFSQDGDIAHESGPAGRIALPGRIISDQAIRGVLSTGLHTDIAVDHNGDWHVVYDGGLSSCSNWAIKYVNATAGVKVIARSSDGNVNSPSIAVDSRGILHVAYRRGADVVYTNNATGDFFEPGIVVSDRPITAAFARATTDVAVQSDGRWHAVYAEIMTSPNRGPVIKYVDSAGEVRIVLDSTFGNVKAPSIDVGLDGVLHLVFFRDGNVDYMNNAAGEFPARGSTISDQPITCSLFSGYTDIAIDANDNWHIVYDEILAAGSIKVVKYVNASDGASVLMRSDSTILGSPSIAFGPSRLPRIPENRVYWSNQVDPETIESVDVVGLRHEVVVANPPNLPRSLTIDQRSGEMLFTTWALLTLEPPSGVFRVGLDGGVPEALVDMEPFANGVQLDLDSGHIYYGTSGGSPVSGGPDGWGQLRRVNTDGTGDVLLIQRDLPVMGVALDMRDQKVYFSEADPSFRLGRSIFRANLDGTEVEPFAPAIGRGMEASLAIDPVTRRLFWSEGDRLVRQDLDGTEPEVLHARLNSNRNLAIDTVNGKIYSFVQSFDIGLRGSGTVLQRFNLDGSEPEVVVEGLSGPYGVGLDLRATLCNSFPLIDNQYEALATAFDIYDDFDGDGLPETASLRLIREIACHYESDLGRAVNLAYNINLDTVADEIDGDDLGDTREAVAALFVTSSSLKDSIVSHLRSQGVVLTGDYVSVRCDATGICVPSTEQALSVREGYRAFSAVRAASDMLTGPGDVDGDAFVNALEYANVLAQGGTLDDFARVATDAALNGFEPLRSAGGSAGGGCFIATAAYGSPLSKELGLLRNFRDRQLLSRTLGSAGVNIYYRTSPAVADRIATTPLLASLVRVALTPLLWVMKVSWLVPWMSLCLLMWAGGTVLTSRVRARRMHA